MSSRVGATVVRAVALTVLTVTGCRVDTTVAIDVERSGAGVVRVRVDLDEEAAAELGDEVDRLQLSDLRAAGWTVERPVHLDPGLRLAVTKPFRGPDDLPRVLAEVSGDDGWLRGWELRVADGFARTTYEVSGRVATAGDLRELGDGGVAAALDGFPIGRSPDELAAALGDDGGVTLTVDVSVPGGGRATRRLDVGAGQARRATFRAEGTVTSRRTQALVLLAVIVGVVGVAVLAGGRVRGRHRTADATAGSASGTGASRADRSPTEPTGPPGAGPPPRG